MSIMPERFNRTSDPTHVAATEPAVEALRSIHPTPPAPGLTLWGSECGDCGNSTPGSMRCDECQTTIYTTPLWIKR